MVTASLLNHSLFLPPSTSPSALSCSNISPLRIRFRNTFPPGLFFPGPGKAFEIGRKKSVCSRISAKVAELTGSITDVDGLHFAVVAARFNEFVSRPLLAGALEMFKRHSIKDDHIDVVWVPGSFEIPVVTQALAKSGKYHAVLCIGAVIRGETTHYDAVANAATSGVLSASINSGVPCIFGVLTCETLEQALNRAGGKSGNKGAEAAVTAIEMASLFHHHLNKLN